MSMGSLNKVMLIGNIGRDADLRYIPSGAPVASFTLATNHSWTDNAGQKQTQVEWHRVVVWNKLAEALAQYLVKGKQIYIEGRLQTKEWEKDGVKRYTTEIRADQIQLLGGGNNSGTKAAPSQAGGPPQDVPDNDANADDIPF